jgi:hypothetical protein
VGQHEEDDLAGCRRRRDDVLQRIERLTPAANVGISKQMNFQPWHRIRFSDGKSEVVFD